MTTLRPRLRRLLALLSVAAFLASLGASNVTAGAAAGVTLTPILGGLAQPVHVTNAGDGTDRLFVVEQAGRIRIVKDGALDPTPFLDIRDVVSFSGEQGLLGLAFHPDYETNGKFYVNFNRAGGDTAINEYRVSSDPDVANRATGRRIMTIDQPYSNHKGGDLAFGPDGYLYIGMGDGGGTGDPGNRARNIDSLLGKMLRIDINGTSSGRQYRIPSTNPWVGKPGLDEIWSRGLRNPWRFSFDRLTGDLWIGDVGQDRYEEINRSTVTELRKGGRGVDYGWRVMEGRHCFNPSSGCDTAGKILPVVEYSHSQGCSVVGGFVYRGAAVAALAGRYVWGDFCTGYVWTISRGATAPAAKSLLFSTGLKLTSFGEDEDGELYLVDIAGGLYKVEAS